MGSWAGGSGGPGGHQPAWGRGMVRAGFAERDCRQNPERQAGIGPGSRRGFVPKAAHQGKGMSERLGQSKRRAQNDGQHPGAGGQRRTGLAEGKGRSQQLTGNEAAGLPGSLSQGPLSCLCVPSSVLHGPESHLRLFLGSQLPSAPCSPKDWLPPTSTSVGEKGWGGGSRLPDSESLASPRKPMVPRDRK